MKKFYILDGDGYFLRSGTCQDALLADQSEEGETLIEGDTPEDIQQPPIPDDFILTQVISDIKTEGLRRVSLQVPALDDFKMIDLMAELWPMLNTSLAGPEILEARRLVITARQLVQQAKGATRQQLEDFDSTQNSNWI